MSERDGQLAARLREKGVECTAEQAAGWFAQVGLELQDRLQESAGVRVRTGTADWDRWVCDIIVSMADVAPPGAL